MAIRVEFNKQEIKKDKFADFMSSARESATANITTIIGVVLGVILIGVVIYFVNEGQASSRAEGQARLSDAKLSISQGNFQLAIIEFQSISNEYEGDAIGEDALFILGTAQYLSDNFSESKLTFERYRKTYKSPQVRVASAIAGSAACSENLGDYSAAAIDFTIALDYFSDGPASGDYALGAVRNHLLNDNYESAVAMRDRIKRDFYGVSDILARAEGMLREIKTSAQSTQSDQSAFSVESEDSPTSDPDPADASDSDSL